MEPTEQEEQEIEKLLLKHIQHRIRKSVRQAPRKPREPSEVHKMYLSRAKSKGLQSDLVLSDTVVMLGSLCEYCGDSGSDKMSFDRIDNTVGYMRTNLVHCCIRCNFARRDMPYKAWLVVAKGMREARERGLFEEWVGATGRRSENSSKKPHGHIVRYLDCKCFICLHAVEEWKAKVRAQPPCPNCGARVFKLNCQRNLTYCSKSCYTEAVSRRTPWPDKDTLAQMVLTRRVSYVASDLGVSITGLKRKCARLGIEVPNQVAWKGTPRKSRKKS